MRKNYQHFFIILAGIISFIISLILYIKSYELYQDEWGTDISFNTDYLVALMLSILIIVYGICSIKKLFEIKLFIKLVSSSILTFYSLGIFFKAISKGKEFVSFQNYLYIGLVAGCFLGSFIINFINKKSQVEVE